MSEAQALAPAAEERVAVASNWTLVWWRFRKHYLALASAFVLGCLYLVVLCPDFFSTQNPELTDARQAFIPVQPLHFFDRGRFSPWVPEIVGKRNPLTLRMEWTQDPSRKVAVQFFASGTGYRVLGLFETQVHLLGSVDPGQRIFLLGSDRLGRDQWSRIMYGTQISMTVGLVAVALSVVLGVVLGGISGYFGGLADQVIQRLIELLQSVPTIPIWLALSAALPRDWTPDPGVLRDYDDPVTGRLDHARARGARPVSGIARGRLRARRETRRLQSAADRSAPHGADVPEPYHCDQFARHSDDGHQRDLALLSRPRDPTTGHQLGRAAPGGHRIFRRWRSPPGC
jgi:ABC-type dipeptide/oligopeptide/nickel transport system permease subunit